MSVSVASAPQNPKSVDELSEFVTESGATLYRWPTGWRYVPPPSACQDCGDPAEELLIWNGRMGLLDDFAGCSKCIPKKLWELKKANIEPRRESLKEEA